MPLLSAFTPCGFLTLSSQPSHAETIYSALANNLGGNYNLAEGERMEAFCYATAMLFARVRYTLEHAGAQANPYYVTEMLADREREYGVVPGYNDNLETRRRNVAARRMIPRGARREAVVDALTTLLGDNFIYYRTTKPAELVNWPTSLGDQPMNLQVPTVPRKVIRLSTAISVGLGAPQTVGYSVFWPSGIEIQPGDVLTVEPEIVARAEMITVTSATSNTITATFNNAHEPNAFATTQPFPMWAGTQRANLIIVDSASAIDAETRRKVSELLQRILRAPSTWAIVEATSSTTTGPFTLNVSPLSATTFGTVTFP